MSAHKAQIESFQTNLLGMIKTHHEEFKRNIGEKLLAGLEKVSGGFNDQSTADKKVILDTITGAMNLQAGLVMQECKKLMDAQNSLAKAQIEKNMGENFSNFGERLQKFEMDCSTAFQNVLARFGNLETGMKNFIGGVDTNFVAVADKIRNLDDKILGIHDFCQNVLVPNDMVVEGVVGHEHTTVSPPLPLRSTEVHQQASSSQAVLGQGPMAAGWQPSGPIGPQSTAWQTGAGPKGPPVHSTLGLAMDEMDEATKAMGFIRVTPQRGSMGGQGHGPMMMDPPMGSTAKKAQNVECTRMENVDGQGYGPMMASPMKHVAENVENVPFVGSYMAADGLNAQMGFCAEQGSVPVSMAPPAMNVTPVGAAGRPFSMHSMAGPGMPYLQCIMAKRPPSHWLLYPPPSQQE